MGETGSCDYAPTAMEAFATVRGYETLERNNYKAVMNHLANVGPLGVYVDASGWDSYSNGVFDGCSYDENIEINHGKSKMSSFQAAIEKLVHIFQPFSWWGMEPTSMTGAFGS